MDGKVEGILPLIRKQVLPSWKLESVGKQQRVFLLAWVVRNLYMAKIKMDSSLHSELKSGTHVKS